MTTFDNREKQFENKFAHDEELNFRANARKNKLLGLWAAEKMGMQGADAEEFAKEVALADFEEEGDGDVLRKVLTSLGSRNIEITESEVRIEMERLHVLARQQIMSES